MQVGPYTLHPHQERAVDLVRQAISRLMHEGKHPRAVLQAPCGFGKTVISSALFSLALSKGKRCAFLASGRQLIFQKSKTLRDCGIPHSVLMSRELFIPDTRCIVASKDTLWARDYELECDLLVVDEAHLGMSEIFMEILKSNPSMTVIGLTATPALGNGKGLGSFYNSIVMTETYENLIQGGFLCPARIYAPYSVDMSGVATNDGEYVMTQVAQRFDKPELVGDVVTHWKNLAEGRPTGVFASGVQHSIHLAEEFNRAGIPAVHMDADTEQTEREDAFGKLKDGTVSVLTNFAILRTGVDLPFISCGQLAVSMNSLNTYLQTCGRFLRTSPLKSDAVIIDHGGNIFRHGWPDQDHAWSLHAPGTVQERDKEVAKKSPPKEALTCQRCGAIRGIGQVCKNCGHTKVRRGELVKFADGTLREVVKKDKLPPKPITDRQKAWNRALGQAARRNGTIDTARLLFVKAMNEWPQATLDYMPGKHQFKVKVAELYPGFVRKKKVAP